MSEFKRVRDVHTKVEYHAPVSSIEKWPEDYIVLDDTIVSEPEPATPAPAKRTRPARSSGSKPRAARTAAATKKTTAEKSKRATATDHHPTTPTTPDEGAQP